MWLKTYKINNEYVKAFSIKLFKTYLFSIQYHEDGGWFRDSRGSNDFQEITALEDVLKVGGYCKKAHKVYAGICR
jgi:hypothetical protein